MTWRWVTVGAIVGLIGAACGPASAQVGGIGAISDTFDYGGPPSGPRRGPPAEFGGFGGFGLGVISAIPRSTVSYPNRERPGTIIINTAQRRLYYTLNEGSALQYGIGVGRVGFTWKGVKSVTQKREWPGWTPPPQMRRRQPGLPAHMAGGIDNPLGARAMYLGSTLYRIHGSNEPDTIGQAVSSGCFRMTNDDVVDLYNRVSVGAKVVVN